MDLKKIIKEKKGTIVDVRTPMEFSGGNAEGSIYHYKSWKAGKRS